MTTIKIKDIELSIKEAKELYEELSLLFDKPLTPTFNPRDWDSTRPRFAPPYDVTCKTGAKLT